MVLTISTTLFTAGIINCGYTAEATDSKDEPMRIWYKQPAKKWDSEALPIGNGRLGGMVFGGIEEEHIQFNVDSLWTGDENPGGGYDHLHMGDYQTFGDLFINFGFAEKPTLTVPSGHKSYYPSENVQQTIDGNPNTKWCIEHNKKTVQWLLTTATPQTIEKYSFTTANDESKRDPQSWKLSGSNDSKNWTVLDIRNNQPKIAARGKKTTYTIKNPQPYKNYRLEFQPTAAVRLQLAEIDLGIDMGVDTAIDSKSDNYIRELDLSNAISTVTYTKNGITYRRETFCSHPDNLIVMRLTADKSKAFSGSIKLIDSRKKPTVAKGSILFFRSTLSNGMIYEAIAKILHSGGTVTATGEKLDFKECDSLTLLLAADTDYKADHTAGWRGEDPHNRIKEQIANAAHKSYRELKNTHIKDYQSLFNRLTISLGKTPPEIMQLPTDKRIARYKTASDDRNLEAIIFQYGRYLLIGSSRPGTLPANLQGIWNNSNTPPWHSDYHSNINLQMNYWLAEPANLAELAEPLFDMLTAGAPVYHKHTVAKYGADTKGFVTRMSITPFGGSGWNWNIEGTAWLAQHFWEHYAFSKDKVFLEETAWPWLRDVSLFWLSQLKTLPDGQLVVPNVWSHEHGPYEDGTAHAQQLMWDLFSNTLAAARILHKDKELQQKLSVTIDKLYGPHIGSWGQLMEWMGEKPALEKSHHRHTSHLFAVYPGHQISREETPEFAKGAELSLLTRGSTGDSRRSWTWPWRCALWARFGNPEKCYEMVHGLFQHNMLSNMFATHPPFQMDGNFGITAGICEMLLQSQTDTIVLLPALPQEWQDGSINGIRARGGYIFDLSWKDGQLTGAVITATVSGKCKVRYGETTKTLKLKAGEKKNIRF